MFHYLSNEIGNSIRLCFRYDRIRFEVVGKSYGHRTTDRQSSVALFTKNLTIKIKNLSVLHLRKCSNAPKKNESLITYVCTECCSFKNIWVKKIHEASYPIPFTSHLPKNVNLATQFHLLPIYLSFTQECEPSYPFHLPLIYLRMWI
jgi:hypothetical protein